MDREFHTRARRLGKEGRLRRVCLVKRQVVGIYFYRIWKKIFENQVQGTLRRWSVDM